MKQGDSRSLLIASPSSGFISYLREQLQYQKQISLGAMRFAIERVDRLELEFAGRAGAEYNLITGTPIVMRIPNEITGAGVLVLVSKYKQTYYRRSHPIRLFVNQLENNLMKKFNAYYKIDDTDKMVTTVGGFHKFRFLKQVAVKVYNSVMIGTCWRLTTCNGKMAKFALDCGLGELNSSGFGFMNLDKERCY
jgi:CRISPR-associated endoribonuclease Cas6